MERIKIENFGGLSKVDFTLNKLNLLIGPQASGKSISVKLIYFFKNFFSDMTDAIIEESTKRDLDSKQKDKFVKYFPKESWPKGFFQIRFESDNYWIQVQRNSNGKNNITFTYSDSLKDTLQKGRKFWKEEKKRNDEDTGRKSSYLRTTRLLRKRFKNHLKETFPDSNDVDQYFIPAGRSFFANIQDSIFLFLSDNKSIDPFLIEFGSFYQNIKKFFLPIQDPETLDEKYFSKVTNDIMGGKHKTEREKDYIIHKDHRKVNLSSASSGQQEILPLILILRYLNKVSFENGLTVYIEEPEAHLFPAAQFKIVKMLAHTFNQHDSKLKIIVTTHSPYVLSSFNNLIEAGNIIEKDNIKAIDVYKTIPYEEVLFSKDLNAYSINKGEKKNIIDEETQLISQNSLDDVSNEISKIFGELLDIEYGEY